MSAPILVPSWVADGLCGQTDPEVFHPGKGEWTTTRVAKAVCARCPVLTRCRDHALANPELEGVWGATTRLERQRIRRQERAA